jgi:hypothetical protein
LEQLLVDLGLGLPVRVDDKEEIQILLEGVGTKFLFFAQNLDQSPTLTLHVNDNDTTFDEWPADFTLFKGPGDTQRNIMAVVFDRFKMTFSQGVLYGRDDD